MSKDLASELIAFANSRGGIFFGVKNSGKIIGARDKNKVKSQIQDVARSCEPQIVVHLADFEDVIIAIVLEGKDKPYECKAGFYARMGPNAQKLTHDEIISFIHNEGYIRKEN